MKKAQGKGVLRLSEAQVRGELTDIAGQVALSMANLGLLPEGIEGVYTHSGILRQSEDPDAIGVLVVLSPKPLVKALIDRLDREGFALADATETH